jgi:hypothetical protein
MMDLDLGTEILLARDPIGVSRLDTFRPVRLLSSKPWARPNPRAGRYWHIPRSASRHDNGLRVSYWCGQGRRDPLLTDEPPPPDDICGTCIGRHLGAFSPDGLIFAPRDAFALPTVCPAHDWGDDGLCIACGARVRAAAGWNAWGTARHAPGPRLAEITPCYFHGWTRMAVGKNGAGCTDWGCR